MRVVRVGGVQSYQRSIDQCQGRAMHSVSEHKVPS